MDDRRVGLAIRALRRRRGWRQTDLASRSTVSQSTISSVERGHVEALSLATFRRILATLDARGDLEIRWRGGGLDRTLDEAHAGLVGEVVGALTEDGWLSAVEVSYSIYGERGSIDLLGFHQATGSLLVVEVKTELTSIEETLRRHDEKVRLASQIARHDLSWRALTTSRLLVLRESTTNRDRVARHARVLDTALPDTNLKVRRWLADPVGTIRGRMLFRNISPRGSTRGFGGVSRVRRPAVDPGSAGLRTDLVSRT